MRLPLACWAWFDRCLALLSFRVVGRRHSVVTRSNRRHELLYSRRAFMSQVFLNGDPRFPLQEVLRSSGNTCSGSLATRKSISQFCRAWARPRTSWPPFARKPVFGYRAMVFTIFAIGMLGFFVWGHHMFISGMSPYSAVTFSIITLSIGVPSAVKTFNWLGTLWGGRIRLTCAMLFALGFVSLFVAGGITGLILGQSSLDLPMHDTYIVLGHFHLVMGVASIFGMFAATYFWFPKMFGRYLNETLGKVHFWITFVGVYAIFIPMHVMGLQGMPRRYSSFTEYHFLDSLHPLVIFVSIAAIVTVLTQFLFYFNLVWSVFKGKRAGENPWEATSLEWVTASPPPHDNFGGNVPAVYRGAYEFSVPGAARDYVMQSDPEGAGQAAH